MKKVAILGGAGFIGSRLCQRLVKRNDISFKILDLAPSEDFFDHYEYVDIRNVESLRSALVGCDVVVNLAAEHKDNVYPVDKYYETNVQGQRNLCEVMSELDIRDLIFTSSVAVYGFVDKDTGEDGEIAPFHEYGDSKYKAEQQAETWYSQGGRKLSVVRPTVVFGEGNRGNVYNLFAQIASGKFLMIGKGDNCKSMAYVENMAAFLEHLLDHSDGHRIFNYIDKPDFDMNTLLRVVTAALGRSYSFLRLPVWLGLLGGYCFDVLSKLTRKEFSVSSLRVRKFCAVTQFKTNTDYAGFKAPVSLAKGLENTVKAEFGGRDV